VGKKEMKKEKKVIILFWAILFFGIAGILFQIVVWENVSNFDFVMDSIKEEITQNNTGLLAVSGVEWWKNQQALEAVAVVLFVFCLVFVLLLPWGMILVFDFFSIAAFCILQNKIEDKESKFFDRIPWEMGEVVLAWPPCWDDICFFNGGFRGVKVSRIFMETILVKIIFFLFSPILISFWILKWVFYGFFRSLELVV